MASLVLLRCVMQRATRCLSCLRGWSYEPSPVSSLQQRVVLAMSVLSKHLPAIDDWRGTMTPSNDNETLTATPASLLANVEQQIGGLLALSPDPEHYPSLAVPRA